MSLDMEPPPLLSRQKRFDQKPPLRNCYKIEYFTNVVCELVTIARCELFQLLFRHILIKIESFGGLSFFGQRHWDFLQLLVHMLFCRATPLVSRHLIQTLFGFF